MGQELRIGRPLYLLTPSEMGVVVLPDLSGDAPILDHLDRLGIPVKRLETSEVAPWKQDELVDLLHPPQWRQLIVVAAKVGAFETALVLMTLEMGFRTYLVIDGVETANGTLERLRNDTVIVMDHATAIAEMSQFPD